MMRSLILLMCVMAFGVHAEVYKWTDASGRVIFSDQPPPASQGKAQRMNLNESRVMTIAADKKTVAASLPMNSKGSDVRAAVSPPPTAKPPKDEKACAEAEKRLTFLKGATMFKQVSNDQGKMEFLPAKQREDEIVERSAFIEKNCR
jgi:hypothetical protein